jgi:anaerobic magnesium-protoporphyrin IX monomethyl ester cyclase
LPPLGIAYIASVLEKAGHRVGIIDAVALNLINEELRQEIVDFSPDIVGITTMTSTLFGSLEAARIAKETSALTVLGGPHLSIYPKETLSYPYVDYGINGEGESVMLKLVDALEQKAPIDSIEGLIYKKDNQIHVNRAAIVDDLDALPFPAYHLLPMRKYDSIIGKYPVSTMISTRGCPYQCHFCFKQPSDAKFRFRSAKNVVDEMEYLVREFGVREIMFYDDVMTFRRSYVADICEEILARKLSVAWETPTRIDKVDKALLGLMCKAGCIRLRYGIESGDEQILKLMNKKIDLRQAKEVFRMTKEAGIETFAYFMVGYAHETQASMKNTINFALELNPDLVMFTVTVAYPQTPLYALAQQEGLIKDDYWREFTLGKKKNQKMPYFFPEASLWIKRAYRRFYLRPGYIFKHLRKIRSGLELVKSLRALRGILSI